MFDKYLFRRFDLCRESRLKYTIIIIFNIVMDNCVHYVKLKYIHLLMR